ncbi:glutamate receptor ionotropic, kainate 2 [Trichonephila clavipes]|nr:glutamate receptor ionotropic, kainate 2 [Trichonephila clavipes]
MCLVVPATLGSIRNPKILCPEDLFQADPIGHNTCRRPFSSSFGTKEKTTTVPQLVADHFQASGRRISATTVRNRSQCRFVCKKTSCVRSPQRHDSEGTAYAGQENMFLGHAATMGFCAVHRRVQIYNGE